MAQVGGFLEDFLHPPPKKARSRGRSVKRLGGSGGFRFWV